MTLPSHVKPLIRPAHLSRGFTLLEVLVTMTIMGILVTLITRAYPTTRTQQQLILAQQQVQFLVREAQQRALNEDREEACLQTVNSTNAKLCSDIGLWFDGPTILMFADTTGTTSTYEAGQDYLIKTVELSSGTSSEGTAQAYVFRGTPPTIAMYVNNIPNQIGTITLRAGQARAALTITPYGQVERH